MSLTLCSFLFSFHSFDNPFALVCALPLRNTDYAPPFLVARIIHAHPCALRFGASYLALRFAQRDNIRPRRPCILGTDTIGAMCRLPFGFREFLGIFGQEVYVRVVHFPFSFLFSACLHTLCFSYGSIIQRKKVECYEKLEKDMCVKCANMCEKRKLYDFFHADPPGAGVFTLVLPLVRLHFS